MTVFKIPQPKKLDEPYKTIHKFIGGPKDGDTHEATVNYELDNSVMLCIDNANYKYIGNDTFEFIGMTSKGAPQKETLKQKIFKWFLS